MSVFISHIHEEAGIALVLKDWIENTFLGQHAVFVSSDPENIAPGDRWFEKIETALDSAKILIILCSPSAIVRPWINIEAGCGLVKKVPVIPVCHSGLAKGKLPHPYSVFQALSIEETDGLIKAIAKHLGVNKLPHIYYSKMHTELSKVLSAVEQCESQSSEMINTLTATKDAKKRLIGQPINNNGLDKDAGTVLLIIAKIAQGSAVFKEQILFELQPMHKETILYYVEVLREANYIDEYKDDYYQDSPFCIKLTHKGRGYLVENKLI